jgi:outer membrane protein assembly factor BamB
MKSILIVLLGLFSIAMTAQGQESWPMINGNAARTSVASMDLQIPLVTTRLYQPGYDFESGMTVLGDKLFLADASDSNHLMAIDLISGEVLWDFGIPGTAGSMDFIPAVHGSTVLAGGQHGEGLYGLDVATGQIKWFHPVRSLYTRVPVIFDGQLFQPTFDSLMCADMESGVVQWSYRKSVPQMAPVVDSNFVYFVASGSAGPEIVAVDRVDGSLVWQNNGVPVSHFTSLTLDSNALYVGYDSTIAALDRVNGQTLWRVDLDAGEKLAVFPSALALSGNILLVKLRSADPSAYILFDIRTGDEVTRYQGVASNNTAPTIIQDYLVEYGSNRIIFLNLLTGEEVYRSHLIPVGGAPKQILVAQNRIYIGGNGPNIAVLESGPTALLDLDEKMNFQISPSPAKTYASLKLNLDQPAIVDVSISTITGTVVSSQRDMYLGIGAHRIDLPIQGLLPGVYSVTLKSGHDTITKLLIVQ